MKCIYCSKKGTQVKNSREIKRGFVTWRRRYCPSCGKIFTTKESSIADNLFVIKRNGSRQRFVYEKFFASIFGVINSRKNSDRGDDAKLAKKVSEKLLEKMFLNADSKEMSTKEIIEMTFKELKKIIPSYADKYASYSDYRTKTLLRSGLINIPEIYR